MMKLKDLGVTREAKTLKNGLRVVLFKKKGAPIESTLSFWAGARQDPANKPGLAHFAEHMLLAGTKKYPTKEKVARYFERFGGHVGGSTGQECLNIDFSVSDKKDFNKLVEMVDQVVNHALVSPALVKTEKGVIIAEIAVMESKANAKLVRERIRVFFPDSQISTIVLGTEESIRSITQKDLKEFIGALKQSPKVMVIAGDIDMETISKQLGKLDLGSAVVNREPIAIHPITQHDIHFPFSGNNVEIGFGYRSVGYNSDDHMILKVIGNVLGGGRGSVLLQKLRSEKGLVYFVGSTNLALSTGGVWLVMTGCHKKDVKQVLNLIKKEIERIKKIGVTPKELAFVKERANNGIKFSLQSAGSWTASHVDTALFGYEETVLDDLERVNQVTNTQIKQVANKYFVEENKIILTVGEKL